MEHYNKSSNKTKQQIMQLVNALDRCTLGEYIAL